MFFLNDTLNDINKKMPVNTFCDSECLSLKKHAAHNKGVLRI